MPSCACKKLFPIAHPGRKDNWIKYKRKSLCPSLLLGYVSSCYRNKILRDMFIFQHLLPFPKLPFVISQGRFNLPCIYFATRVQIDLCLDRKTKYIRLVLVTCGILKIFYYKKIKPNKSSLAVSTIRASHEQDKHLKKAIMLPAIFYSKHSQTSLQRLFFLKKIK